MSEVMFIVVMTLFWIGLIFVDDILYLIKLWIERKGK